MSVVTVETCQCAPRRAMSSIHLFRFSWARDGWVFVTSPHYAWRECPWCQQLLPSTSCVVEAIKDEERRKRQDAEGETGG